MKASLQPKPMYCSRDYYYSSRFNQQYEKLTPVIRKITVKCQGHVLESFNKLVQLLGHGWPCVPTSFHMLSMAPYHHMKSSLDYDHSYYSFTVSSYAHLDHSEDGDSAGCSHGVVVLTLQNWVSCYHCMHME